MTGISELAQTVIVSAAPRTIRVSVFGGRTQLDIELPADTPVVDLIPELAALITSRSVVREDTDDTLENRRDRWVLTRLETGDEIRGEQTLAQVGSRDGDLLSLTAERALTPPELFDDVVDAVARLNRAGYATWGRAAARVMAFAAIFLTVGVVDMLLLGNADLGTRTLVGYQSVGVLVALVVAAAVAVRHYADPMLASVLGWAAVLLLLGVASVFTEHLPDAAQSWRPAVVCLIMVVGAAGGWLLIRAGWIGFLCTAAAFSLLAVAAVAHAGFHWSPQTTGCVIATGGVLLALMTSSLTPRLRRRVANVATQAADVPAEERELFTNPFDRSSTLSEHRRAAARARARVPSADDVAAAVERFRATRDALFLAAAAVAITGCCVAYIGTDQPAWSVITYTTLVGITLILGSARGLPYVPSAIVLIAGVAVLVITAVSLRWTSTLTYCATAVVLLGIAVVSIVVGSDVNRTAKRSWSGAADRMEYVAVIALLPVLGWAVGLYDAVLNR